MKDGQERPLNIEAMLYERNKFYDDVIFANSKTQTQNLEYHNNSRERQPPMEPDKVVFKMIQGIKRKTKERYKPTKAIEDKGRIILDSSGREIHKENLKRV